MADQCASSRVKRGMAAVLAGGLMAAGAGCGADSGTGSDDTIKIGAWVATSGPVASAGVPQMTGSKVYFDMANDGERCGGRRVEWITKDVSYDPQRTLQAARELIQRDRVVAIVSPYGTITSEAAFPFVLQQSKTPIFGVAGGSLSWYKPAQDLLFGVEPVLQDHNAVMVKWAAEEGAKNFLVVHSDPASVAANAAEAVKLMQSIDPSVKTGTLPVKYGTTDYSPVIRDVIAKKPDAVLLNLSPEEAAVYIKEAKLQGLKAKTYSYGPATSPAVLELAGDAAEGMRGASLVKMPDGDTPELKEFRDAMAKYAPDAVPSTITLAGFGRAKAFCQFVGQIDGEITRESLAKGIAEGDPVDTGIYPPIQYGEGDRLGTRSIQRVKVENGEFVAVGDFVEPPSAN